MLSSYLVPFKLCYRNVFRYLPQDKWMVFPVNTGAEEHSKVINEYYLHVYAISYKFSMRVSCYLVAFESK